ncbi:TetR/AcrR family transcriptional regulator [Mucilaginibacter sabulilitoris]|uniref:TetR/AcrR family transcriptional regulator n=1 Tax=Mucilaginibacter sabulilitoris TaxID=1173583 RepID=A0ABZ0THI7_9SPHI|nr:TetR/AcrR family transcriptional regulator [Mucilaginibacter sabulilitoris]WPU92259.1 TetR/AcrR family transcriptional regulator [Mucilaginibacter sabulilitoris]
MTKEDIIQNALKQFLLNGIRKMTIQQIIAPLGISTKTVYKHFNSKEELLEACLVIHYGRMSQEFNDFGRSDMDPANRLFFIFFKGLEEDFKAAPVFYHDLNYYYPEIHDNVLSKYQEIYHKFIINAIKDGIDQGYFHPELHEPVVLETLGLLYRSLTRTGQYDKFELSPFDLVANTLTIYLRGICTAKGIKILNNLKPLSS